MPQPNPHIDQAPARLTARFAPLLAYGVSRGAIVIAFMMQKHLRLVFKAPESVGVYNPVTVTLKLVARRAIISLMATPKAFKWIGRIGGQRHR